GELVFVVPVEPPSYDAHREGTFGLLHPAAPHYNTLLRVDPTDRTGTKVIGDLAESWTIGDGGRPYTGKLRPGGRLPAGRGATSPRGLTLLPATSGQATTGSSSRRRTFSPSAVASTWTSKPSRRPTPPPSSSG